VRHAAKPGRPGRLHDRAGQSSWTGAHIHVAHCAANATVMSGRDRELTFG
jgi:hypothetical protein